MKPTKGAIAAGHPETAKAAEEILQDGGNAFDAVLAAHLAACVAEPVLTSLGGGGFMIAKKADGSSMLYDFFVQTPIRTHGNSRGFFPISADFGDALQEFYIGPGSVATPGTIKGIFAIHKELCTMPPGRIAEPAIRLAQSGVVVNKFQAVIFDVIKPIFFSNNRSKKIYKSRQKKGQLITEGELLKLPGLADFMETLVREGDSFFYEGETADKISEICRNQGGHLTKEDLKSYSVIKRKPLTVDYRNHSIRINPPPGSGGILIAFALKLMEKINLKAFTPAAESFISLLANIQELTNHARIDAYVDGTAGGSEKVLLHPEYIKMYKEKIRPDLLSPRGTTHISVMDEMGNMAGLSTSNGEGSGLMIPGTGIMLNNMLGEEDLNPGGFYNWPSNQRMTSMMAPGILQKENGQHMVFGSGGSNRIRSAILQVILNYVDFGMSLEQAINAPRIHVENGLLNAEQGLDIEMISKLGKKYPDHIMWKEKNLFFGGVHAVSGGPEGFSGFGDPRRGGVSIISDSGFRSAF